MHAVGQQIQIAVAVDIVEPARLHAAGLGDDVRGPLAERLARVLNPFDALAAPVDLEEIQPAVPVDVIRLRGEAVGHAANDFHVPDLVRLPCRRLVPEAPADNVDVAIVIHVESGGG